MAARLVQVRECDGQCCKESPRWPDAEGSCRFLIDGQCAVMAGNLSVPDDPSPAWPDRHPLWVFNETCRAWPHNSKEGRDTGGCCWQWVDDDGS